MLVRKYVQKMWKTRLQLGDMLTGHVSGLCRHSKIADTNVLTVGSCDGDAENHLRVHARLVCSLTPLYIVSICTIETDGTLLSNARVPASSGQN